MMTQKTNSFEKFWKELKRRKVVNVITVYAAIAFVILQLVDMVSQPLHFPEWGQGFIIVLLCIGFVIAIFLSWVYDITPAGVKKTKPGNTVKHIDQTIASTSSAWKISTYISGVIIIALVAFNFINGRNLNADLSKLEKSIAVLPFMNDSPSDSNQYFINGIMDEILNNLQTIKEFRVLSRTSTDQYKGSDRPTIPEIARKLNVNYVVEGSGQKYGNKFVLRVQLITGKNERHLWGKSYDREIHQTTDIIGVQGEIAQLIAGELKATITPEEKQLIEKTPTANLTAFDFYQRGREEYTKYLINNTNRAVLKKAEGFYRKALKYDSAFAQAYTGLARVYWDKHYWEEYFSRNFMDSILILTNIALSFDNQLSEAYTLKGTYYCEIGKPEKAIEEFDKAIKYNPNYWEAYLGKANFVYLGDLNNSDYVKGLEYIHKAASINHGKELSGILGNLGFAYTYYAGFPEVAKKYFQEALGLDGDTISYLAAIGSLEIQYGDFENGIEKSLKAFAKDSAAWRLANQYLFHGEYKEALKYYRIFIERSKSLGWILQGNQQMIGFVYWQNGFKKEAEYWFNEQKRLSQESQKLGRYYFASIAFGSSGYYDLAGVYAFTGEKEKAYEILRIIDRYPIFPLSMVDDIKRYNPLFNSLRNEPEFQHIVRDMEAKYQAEHERVRKWLEENNML